MRSFIFLPHVTQYPPPPLLRADGNSIALFTEAMYKVPALYDVLPAYKANSRFAPGQNVGGVERGRRGRPGGTEPRAAY
jgi:hypothetical protein